MEFEMEITSSNEHILSIRKSSRRKRKLIKVNQLVMEVQDARDTRLPIFSNIT